MCREVGSRGGLCTEPRFKSLPHRPLTSSWTASGRTAGPLPHGLSQGLNKKAHGLEDSRSHRRLAATERGEAGS